MTKCSGRNIFYICFVISNSCKVRHMRRKIPLSNAQPLFMEVIVCSSTVYGLICFFFYFLPFLLCSIFHHEQHVQLPRLVSGKNPGELSPLDSKYKNTVEGNMLFSAFVGKEAVSSSSWRLVLTYLLSQPELQRSWSSGLGLKEIAHSVALRGQHLAWALWDWQCDGGSWAWMAEAVSVSVVAQGRGNQSTDLLFPSKSS